MSSSISPEQQAADGFVFDMQPVVNDMTTNGKVAAKFNVKIKYFNIIEINTKISNE